MGSKSRKRITPKEKYFTSVVCVMFVTVPLAKISHKANPEKFGRTLGKDMSEEKEHVVFIIYHTHLTWG